MEKNETTAIFLVYFLTRLVKLRFAYFLRNLHMRIRA